MGLIDKLKAYLNEEEYDEPVSERESANSRVRLQAIEEDYEFEDVDIKEIEEDLKDFDEKQKALDEAEYAKENIAQTTKSSKRNIQFMDETRDEIKDNASTGHIKLDEKTDDKLRRKAEKKRQKAMKRLSKEIKKKGDSADETGKKKRVSKVSNEERRNRKNDKIKSEGQDIGSLILDKSTPQEARRQAVSNFCDQLVDASYHMEDMKREYKLISTYLTDIQRIDELPIEYANEVIQLASNIDELDKNRETYLQSENLLNHDQYTVLAQLEKEVPGAIKKLYDMEVRDSMLKSDMGHLEGEKEDLKYMREEYDDSISRIRGVIITFLILGFITIGIIASVAYTNKSSVTNYVLGITAFLALVFAVGYARYVTLIGNVKINDARLAKAISLLNKVKAKYINNTNTLDYMYEKYGVHSCSELEYTWDRYNTMVRDMLRYSETNQELRKAKEEYVRRLSQLGISEPNVWTTRISAILDRREMVELRHNLNGRRQKLRESMQTCEKIRSNAVTALRASVAENPGMMEVIQDILKPYNLSIT